MPKLEYIWLDGNEEPHLRSKTKVVSDDDFYKPNDNPAQDPSSPNYRLPTPGELPIWFFDGSSTMQAEGHYSDCMLKPVKMIYDPGRKDAFLVLCEVWLPDGSAPHPSNTRATFDDREDIWFGFEQEYVLINPATNRPLGFPAQGFPAPQGDYYCGVGANVVEGRDIMEAHLDMCLAAGLELTGTNAEVLLGQWEYQVLGKGAKNAADSLWLARYLLYRVSERFGVRVEHHPKPVRGDWNGSGLHTNFSTERMRKEGGKELFDAIFAAFEKNKDYHVDRYGLHNDLRMTGLHETSKLGDFTHGVSHRGCSIRIPQSTVQANWVGYLEDRRPASNADPYQIAQAMVKSLTEAESSVAITLSS